MSRDIRVSVKRSGAVASLLKSVPVRLDNISPILIAGSGGAIPHYTYQLLSLEGTPDIRQGDLLIDTKDGTQYRVSGEPEIFDQSHLEVLVERNVQVSP